MKFVSSTQKRNGGEEMNLEKQKQIAEEKIKEIDVKLEKKKNLNGKRKPMFFTFRQNNSGGHFVEDEDVCENVIVEAHSPEDANLRADDIGIYFDGCEQGLDCSCCGDRWNEIYEDEKGTEIPMIYGKDVTKIYAGMYSSKVIIHHLDGTKKEIIFKTEKDCPKHKWKQKYDIGRQCEICGKWEDKK